MQEKISFWITSEKYFLIIAQLEKNGVHIWNYSNYANHLGQQLIDFVFPLGSDQLIVCVHVRVCVCVCVYLHVCVCVCMEWGGMHACKGLCHTLKVDTKVSFMMVISLTLFLSHLVSSKDLSLAPFFSSYYVYELSNIRNWKYTSWNVCWWLTSVQQYSDCRTQANIPLG